MAENSSKYSTRPFGTKSTYDLQSADKEQTAIVYDLLSEGPIYGLANGTASVYYNDVPLVDSANHNIIKPRKGTVTTTASSTTVTGSIFGDILALSYNNKSGLNIGARYIVIEGAGAKGTGIASITAGSSTVTTSSSYFTSSMLAQKATDLPVYLRITGAGPNGTDLVTTIKTFTSATEVEITSRAATTVSGANIVIDHYTRILTITNSTTAVINTAAPTAVSGGNAIISAPYLPETTQISNFSNVAFGMVTGTRDQSPLQMPGFTGSSSTVYDFNGQIRQADLYSVSGLSSLGTSYNAVNIDEPGNENQGSASDTVLTASVMGVSNPEEIDEIHLTFSFPEMHAFKSSGAKGTSFVEFQIFFEYTTDGLNYISALAFGPSNSTILSRSAPWGNRVTYGVDNDASIPNNGYVKPRKAQYSEFIEEFVMKVDQFQPFSNYRIRIRRLTDEDFKDGSFQHKNASYLKTVENVTLDKLNYPYAAYAGNVFNAKDFSGGLPSRAYKLKEKLIQVPTNYLTRDESSDGTAKYTRSVSGSAGSYSVVENASYQTWDGSFRGDRNTWSEGHPNRDLVYCNNPAWVFYDILTNNRYGLGQFVDRNLIDKYSLFEIAKYCDELVSDGEGGLEPRFTTNLYLSKTAEATKVLRDIASIFRGMVLWLDGEIVAISDRPKEIVYTFTKGNVENGAFTYEGTGDRVRTNQVKVTWNDPKDNYRQAVEYVEDHQNIVKTNRLVRESSIAMGCTSRAQAHRYGKWKLLSAQLEKETVTFTTGLNVAGLRPGDIIGVQDADKDGVSYSGRVSNSGTLSTTVIPLDRTITLPSYSADFPPQLLLIYPEGGCYLQQETATINGTTYFLGDLLLETDTGAVLDTQEEAANLKDDSGNSVLNYWSENVRVEKKSISTSAGSVSSLTVSSAFSSIPDTEVIWALQVFNTDGTPKVGSTKEFKVVSIKEEKDQKFQIVAAEFARAKFNAVDRGYTIYSRPINSVPDRDDVVAAPRNVTAKVEAFDPDSPDTGTTIETTATGTNVTVSWDYPLNSDGTKYKNIAGFEIKHSFNGGFEILRVNASDQSYTFTNVKIGSYAVYIRTYTTINTFSAFIERNVTVSEQSITLASVSKIDLLPRGGLINKALSINTSTGLAEIGGSGTYNITTPNAKDFTFSSTGTANYQQSFSGMGASATAYLLFDASATSDHLKAVQVHTDTNVSPSVTYFKEVGAANNGLTQAAGTVAVTQFSNQIDGTTTTFTSDFSAGDLIQLNNGTASESFYARVQYVESDTLMFMDAVAPLSFSGDDIYKQSFKPDFVKDTIISEVTTDGSTVYSLGTIYAVTAGLIGADGEDGATGASVNIVFQRASSAPATPSASAGVPSGWYDSPPSGTNLLWAVKGTKAVGASTFTWGTVFQVEGTAVAEVAIYIKASSASTPTGGSYNFTTSTLTPPTSWSTSVPAISANGDKVYLSVGLFTGSPEQTAATTTWSTPVLYAQRTDGAAGDDGLRTIQGYLYYEKTTAGAPSAPSGNTYTFSTGVVSGTGINDAGTTNVWKNSPNTQDATSTNTFYTVRYYGTEASANSSTITVTYSSVVQQTNFSGVVTFSGGTFSEVGGSAITTIDGDNITTGQIQSSVTGETSTFTSAGALFDLTNAEIKTPYFYSTNTGAGFKGTVTVGGTNLTTSNTLNENTTPANISSNMSGVTLTSSGQIYSGKSSYGSGTGWYLEYNSGTPRFDIGSTSNYMRWDGTNVNIKGKITLNNSTTELNETNTLNSNTTSSDVGLGNVDNLDSSGQIQDAFDNSTLIDSGKIKLSATSGSTTNYIEIDATNGRILIADAS